MQKLFFLLLALFITPQFLFSSTENKTLLHQGIDRNYLLYVPDSIKENASLVVVIHGYTSTADNIMGYSRMNRLADENNFVVAYPQGTVDVLGNTFFNVGYSFNSNSTIDDVSFIEAMVLEVQKNYPLNPKNTFATGMSNGGDMSYLLACKKSTLFAAVAPVAGVMMKDTLDSCDPERNIPLFEIHGTKDEISRYEGDIENNDGWGFYYDMPSTIKFWVQRHGLEKEQFITLKDKDYSDGSSIVFERYSSDLHSREVWFYRIEGGDHTWPGWKKDIKWWKNPLLWYYLPLGNNDIDASSEVWSFFKRYVEE